MCADPGGGVAGVLAVCVCWGGGVSEQAGLEQAGRDAVCRPRGGGGVVVWINASGGS